MTGIGTQLTKVSEKDQYELAIKYVPENAVSPKAYVDVVKTQIMGGKGTFEDMIYFLEVCKRSGLDPTIRQIYAVFRWNTRAGREIMSIQTGIDGMRSTAEKTGLYAGSDDGVFIEGEHHPEMATVTVYKLNKITGERMPVTASARWDEYVVLKPKTGEPEMMWKKMSHTMLEKCAEAKALRKAFPICAGIYVQEEMAPAEESLPLPVKKELAPQVEETKQKALEGLVEGAK